MTRYETISSHRIDRHGYLQPKAEERKEASRMAQCNLQRTYSERCYRRTCRRRRVLLHQTAAAGNAERQ